MAKMRAKNTEIYLKMHQLLLDDPNLSFSGLCKQHGVTRGAFAYWRKYQFPEIAGKYSRKRSKNKAPSKQTFLQELAQPAPPKPITRDIAVIMVKGDSAAVNRVMKDFFNV